MFWSAADIVSACHVFDVSICRYTVQREANKDPFSVSLLKYL